MKKALKMVALAVALMMAVSLFAGCGASGDKPADKPAEKAADKPADKPADKSADKAKPAADGKLLIGFSLPTQQEERWVRDKEKVEAECKAKGIDVAVQIANMDAAKQDAQCDNLLAQGIKVLILAPHDAKSAASIVDKAHKAGVKVISYDRLVMGTDVDLYISFDNVKVGEIQGKYFTEKVAKGNIVWLSGAPTDNNAKLFKQGAAKFLQPKIDSGDYKVVMEQAVVDWKPENALKLMENALTANKNNIQGVLAPNDGTAGGCIQALASQGLAGKVPITGQDAELAAAKRIVEGTQSMTVYKDTRELGKAAVEAAIKMAKGEDAGANSKVNNDKMDVPSVLLTPVAVDKSNIDEVLINGGYLKKEDVYKK